MGACRERRERIRARPRRRGGSAAVVVVIPTLNEEQSIAQVVRSIPRDLVARIIVADGGSRDATAARAKDAGAELIAAGAGYGRACLAAALAAEAAGILVFMDGDGADDPKAIGRLIDPIRAGQYDLVIGSRARGKRAPGQHRLASAGRRSHGGLGHAAALWRSLHRHVCVPRDPARLPCWRWECASRPMAGISKCRCAPPVPALRILEIPVDYRRRSGGQSKVAGSLAGSVRAGARILATFWRIATESR